MINLPDHATNYLPDYISEMNVSSSTLPANIVTMIKNNNVRAILTFVEQNGWPEVLAGHSNSDELIEAGEEFIKTIMVESVEYPLQVWLVVPEHRLVHVLEKDGLKALSFRIIADDNKEEIMLIMKIKNKDAFDKNSVLVRPKNDYDF